MVNYYHNLKKEESDSHRLGPGGVHYMTSNGIVGGGTQDKTNNDGDSTRTDIST